MVGLKNKHERRSSLKEFIMIQLSLESAITLYFVITTLMIAIPWVYFLLLKKKGTKSFSPVKLHQCEYCLASFLDTEAKKVPRCPTCGSYNTPSKNQSQ